MAKSLDSSDFQFSSPKDDLAVFYQHKMIAIIPANSFTSFTFFQLNFCQQYFCLVKSATNGIHYDSFKFLKSTSSESIFDLVKHRKIIRCRRQLIHVSCHGNTKGLRYLNVNMWTDMPSLLLVLLRFAIRMKMRSTQYEPRRLFEEN